MVQIDNYWFEKQTNHIVNLLKEYKDILVRHYKDLKGLVEKMREMKIELNPRENPINK
jgi:hypothetical protein